MEKLISILTPTYNYGHFIHRLLDSVLEQTYGSVEMFVIDDGSTDNTRHIVEGYFEKFKKKGYALRYIWQENQRQAVAVNNGLKLINGEYLVWPDADDWYAEPDALEIMATTLDGTTDDVSSCRSLAWYVNDNLDILGKTWHNATERMFEDCLFASNFAYPSGFIMAKTKILFSQLDNRTIYTGKNYGGQNWQLLLPIFYKHSCIPIDKVLYNILAHQDSDSRVKHSYEKKMEINQAHSEALETILKDMKSIQDEERKDLISKVKTKYAIFGFLIHCSHGKKKDAMCVYKQMRTENMLIPAKIKLLYGLSFIPFGVTLRRAIICSIKKILSVLGIRK